MSHSVFFLLDQLTSFRPTQSEVSTLFHAACFPFLSWRWCWVSQVFRKPALLSYFLNNLRVPGWNCLLSVTKYSFVATLLISPKLNSARGWLYALTLRQSTGKEKTSKSTMKPGVKIKAIFPTGSQRRQTNMPTLGTWPTIWILHHVSGIHSAAKVVLAPQESDIIKEDVFGAIKKNESLCGFNSTASLCVLNGALWFSSCFRALF